MSARQKALVVILFNYTSNFCRPSLVLCQSKLDTWPNMSCHEATDANGDGKNKMFRTEQSRGLLNLGRLPSCLFALG